MHARGRGGGRAPGGRAPVASLGGGAGGVFMYHAIGGGNGGAPQAAPARGALGRSRGGFRGGRGAPRGVGAPGRGGGRAPGTSADCQFCHLQGHSIHTCRIRAGVQRKKNLRLLAELKPPVDTPGAWLLLEDFTGRKSFGKFQCACRHVWRSAHAFRDFRQGCQRCEAMTRPWAMWQNDRPREPEEDSEESSESVATESSDVPHDAARCEAGRAGQCEVCARDRSRFEF